MPRVQSIDQDLVQKVADIERDQAALNQRRADVAAEKAKRLEAKHLELVAECRKAKENYDGLTSEAERLNYRVFQFRGEQEKAEHAIGNWRMRKPAPTDYPSPQEMSAWEREFHRLEKALRDAQTEEGNAWTQYEAARHARNTAQDLLRKLADEEADLRNEVEHRDGIPRATITFQRGA